MAGDAAGSDPDPGIVVGERVTVGRDRDRATVRYVGRVEGQAGVWVGLEWDDPSRGKHDGSTGGVKYFDVVGGPTAGSFVRAEKVQPGVPLLAALRARYNNETAEGAAAGAPAGRAVYLSSASNRRRVLVELVGEERVTERQRRTELLERARVVDACVGSVVSRARGGCVSAAPKAHPPAMRTWGLQGRPPLAGGSGSTVYWAAARAAPSNAPSAPGPRAFGWSGGLRRALTACRPLPPPHPVARAPQDPPEELQAALPNLAELDLTGNLLWRWREPEALLSALPGLHTLNLSSNRLSLPSGAAPAAPPLQRLTGLRALVLNGCGVAWRDACALQLAALPCLRELHVAGNGISSLAFEPGSSSSSSSSSGGGGVGGCEGSSASGGDSKAAGCGQPSGHEDQQSGALPPPLPALHGIEVGGSRSGPSAKGLNPFCLGSAVGV
jgi:hypothetical protein